MISIIEWSLPRFSCRLDHLAEAFFVKQRSGIVPLDTEFPNLVGKRGSELIVSSKSELAATKLLPFRISSC